MQESFDRDIDISLLIRSDMLRKYEALWSVGCESESRLSRARGRNLGYLDCTGTLSSSRLAGGTGKVNSPLAHGRPKESESPRPQA